MAGVCRCAQMENHVAALLEEHKILLQEFCKLRNKYGRLKHDNYRALMELRNLKSPNSPQPDVTPSTSVEKLAESTKVTRQVSKPVIRDPDDAKQKIQQNRPSQSTGFDARNPKATIKHPEQLKIDLSRLKQSKQTVHAKETIKPVKNQVQAKTTQNIQHCQPTRHKQQTSLPKPRSPILSVAEPNGHRIFHMWFPLDNDTTSREYTQQSKFFALVQNATLRQERIREASKRRAEIASKLKKMIASEIDGLPIDVSLFQYRVHLMRQIEAFPMEQITRETKRRLIKFGVYEEQKRVKNLVRQKSINRMVRLITSELDRVKMYEVSGSRMSLPKFPDLA